MRVRQHFLRARSSRGDRLRALLTVVADGSLAWFLGPLLASTVYLLVSALELVLARGAHEVAGTENIDER